GGIHAAEGDVVIDLPSSADGIGRHIDIKSFGQQVVNGLSNADVRLDAADEDLPDAAIAPGSEDFAALAAAKSRLPRNDAEQAGQLRRRGSEPLRVLLCCRKRNSQNFRAIDQSANVPDDSGVPRN